MGSRRLPRLRTALAVILMAASVRPLPTWGGCPTDALTSLLAADGLRGDARKPFEVGRGLLMYLDHFSWKYEEDLARLGAGDRILDTGCGEARFAEDLYLPRYPDSALQIPLVRRLGLKPPERRPGFVGVAYRRPAAPPESFGPPGKVRFIATSSYGKGKLFEDVPVEDILGGGPRFPVIQDEFGVMSYSYDPARALEKDLRLLRPDGVIHIHWGMAGHDSVSTGLFKSEALYEWLKSIPGLAVETVRQGQLVRITRKPGQAVMIPRLELKSVAKTGHPPKRKFRRSKAPPIVVPAE